MRLARLRSTADGLCAHRARLRRSSPCDAMLPKVSLCPASGEHGVSTVMAKDIPMTEAIVLGLGNNIDYEIVWDSSVMEDLDSPL